MLLVGLPMLFRTMCRETAVRAFERDVLSMRNMGVSVCKRGIADRTGCKLFDSFATLADRGERGAGKGMEEVVLGEDGFARLRCCLGVVLFEKAEQRPSEYGRVRYTTTMGC